MFKQIWNLLKGSSNPNDLSGADFKAKYTETPNAIMLDVRTKAEVNSGILKGAKNIDFFSSNFKTEVQKLDKNKTYFVYCRSGNRSKQAALKLENLGYTNLYEFGGIITWPYEIEGGT